GSTLSIGLSVFGPPIRTKPPTDQSPDHAGHQPDRRMADLAIGQKIYAPARHALHTVFDRIIEIRPGLKNALACVVSHFTPLRAENSLRQSIEQVTRRKGWEFQPASKSKVEVYQREYGHAAPASPSSAIAANRENPGQRRGRNGQAERDTGPD